MKRKSGRVIFMNGTSSSGKSTLAKALQKSLGEPYFHVSFDKFLCQLPNSYLKNRKYLKKELPILLAGFNRSNAAIARSGNNVIVDHILEEPSWVAPCIKAFEDLEVVFIGVLCSLDELEFREKARGNRGKGVARYQYDRVHSNKKYDVEVDTSTMTVRQCVSTICKYVRSGQRPTAFEMLKVHIEDATPPCGCGSQ